MVAYVSLKLICERESEPQSKETSRGVRFANDVFYRYAVEHSRNVASKARTDPITIYQLDRRFYVICRFENFKITAPITALDIEFTLGNISSLKVLKH